MSLVRVCARAHGVWHVHVVCLEADLRQQMDECGPSTDAFSACPPAATAECWQLARAGASCVGTATLLQCVEQLR